MQSFSQDKISKEFGKRMRKLSESSPNVDLSDIQPVCKDMNTLQKAVADGVSPRPFMHQQDKESLKDQPIVHIAPTELSRADQLNKIETQKLLAVQQNKCDTCLQRCYYSRKCHCLYITLTFVCIGLFFWTLFDSDHHPDSWVFLLFEIVINLFMIVDLSLKMRLHGCKNFWKNWRNVVCDFCLTLICLVGTMLWFHCKNLLTPAPLKSKMFEEIGEDISFLIRTLFQYLRLCVLIRNQKKARVRDNQNQEEATRDINFGAIGSQGQNDTQTEQIDLGLQFPNEEGTNHHSPQQCGTPTYKMGKKRRNNNHSEVELGEIPSSRLPYPSQF